MERYFVCPDCASIHNDPADAGLGHLIACLDCAGMLDDSWSVLLVAGGVAVIPDAAVAA